MKKIIAFALTLILMLSLAGCGNSDTASAEKAARTADTYNTVEEGGLSFQLPDYFGESEMSGDVKNYYAETGNSITVLQMYSVDGLLDEDSFENDCNEIYDSFMSGLKESDDISDFQDGSANDATLGCGLHCMIYTYSFTTEAAGCNAIMTLINNTESNKVVMVSITQSEQSEYDYTDAYTEIVDKCEIISNETESSGTESESAGSDSGLLSPEFKKTMDDYEAWFDHYCDVMKRYEADSSDLELLSEMTALLSEETTMLEELENMDESKMNAAELAYYIEVTARIEKKLLEVSGY